MKTILITGGAGFIGSNLVRYLLKRHPDYYIINADLLTYAGSLANLAGIEGNERHTFVRADVRSRDDMEAVFARGPIDAVIHLAAHSHVDRSIDTPGEFLLTNVVGTQVVLDCAKRYWSLRPDDRYCREYRRGVRFLQVSTDEVYGTLGGTGRFTESSPLAPNSPYSASKASADLMVRAYHETYGLPALITRCANNYGPYQFPEKLIPLMIRRGLQEQPLPVYGDGLQRREWLHVSDHCAAL
ncbi:MAG: dTDP-glucose 4,6-dehydratase, partial [Acetanaerobacterium sp.]